MQKFFDLIMNPLRDIFTSFVQFLPNLLAMVVIIVIGTALAWIIRVVALKLLKAINLDSWSDRLGVTSIMRKGNVWAMPSATVSSALFWVVIIMVILAGLSALKIETIDSLIAQFIMYLPRVMTAFFIVVAGYIVTGFISRTILISAVNKGYHYAKLLAEATRILLILLFIAMALEQLQVAPIIVTAAFSITFSGIVLAVAIAFGVGGIEAAKKIIEREDEKQEDGKNDIDHI